MADTRSIQRTATGPRFAYPVSLDVAGRRAVVVGAGAVALGKADALLEAGALVTVIADGPPQALQRLEEAGATIERRGFEGADLDEAFLCVAASDAALLGEVREQTLPLLPDVGERSRRWRDALELEELEELARAGRLDQARERLLARLVGPREPAP